MSYSRVSWTRYAFVMPWSVCTPCMWHVTQDPTDAHAAAHYAEVKHDITKHISNCSCNRQRMLGLRVRRLCRRRAHQNQFMPHGVDISCTTEDAHLPPKLPWLTSECRREDACSRRSPEKAFFAGHPCACWGCFQALLPVFAHKRHSEHCLGNMHDHFAKQTR